eukprot:31489-Pelagococcus_subviridis.AAC.6
MHFPAFVVVDVFTPPRHAREVHAAELKLLALVKNRDPVPEHPPRQLPARAPLVLAVDSVVPRGVHRGLERVVVVIDLLKAHDVRVFGDYLSEELRASRAEREIARRHRREPRVRAGERVREDVVLYHAQGIGGARHRARVVVPRGRDGLRRVAGRIGLLT